MWFKKKTKYDNTYLLPEPEKSFINFITKSLEEYCEFLPSKGKNTLKNEVCSVILYNNLGPNCYEYNLGSASLRSYYQNDILDNLLTRKIEDKLASDNEEARAQMRRALKIAGG